MKLPKAAWTAVALLALAALWAWKTGYLWPEPSLDPNPLAIQRGEAVLRSRCWHCHETIPLAHLGAAAPRPEEAAEAGWQPPGFEPPPGARAAEPATQPAAR